MLEKLRRKQKFLRFASFFLMAILLLGTIQFSEPKTVKAANGSSTRRMAYVLSNVYGKSGAGSSTAIPGSSSLPAPFNKSHVSMYGMAVYTGNTYRLTYCIGHNIHLPAGTELHDYNNIYSSNNGGDTWYKLDDWQKQYLQLALTFGLNDENATHTRGGIQSLINSNKALYGVTQTMVWGIVHSKSRAWFSSNHTKIRNHFLVSADYEKFNQIYDNIVSAYNKEIPSFAKETKANAKAGVKLLKGNNMEKASTYTFKDSMLKTGKNNKKGYTEIEGISTTSKNAKASDIKAKINHDTGQLTVTCPKGTVKAGNDTRTYTIKLRTYYGKYNEYKNKTQAGVPMATCWQRSNHKGQPQVQHTDKINVTSSYVAVQVKGLKDRDEPSTLSIQKTSSDGIVDGWRFFIRANATETNYYNTVNKTDYEVSQLYAKEITTDGGGNAIITDLDAGVYDLWEVGYGYARYSKSNTGVESETGYAYSEKDQSAILGMYKKTASASTAYNSDTSKMYTAKNKDINITSDTNSNGGTSGLFNKYNQGHIRIVIRKDSKESITIHNERLTNSMNVQKTYIKNEDCPSWGSQVILDDATISLSASVNAGSAWASLHNNLRTKFGINYYYDKTNIADMLIQEASGYKASTGDFNILPKINARGAAYTVNDGDTDYYVTASSSGKLTETVSSQGTKLYSMTNDGNISDLTGNIPLYHVTNIQRDRFLEIEKKDAVTHERVKREGFGFEVHDAYSGKKLANSKGQTTFYTDDTGIATFGTYDKDKTGHIRNVKKERVPYGTYIVYETEAPSPYIKSERTFYFTVSPEGTEFFDDADDPEHKNLDPDLVESTTTDSGERTEDDVIQEDAAYGSNYTIDEEEGDENSLTVGDSNDYSEGTGEDSTEMDETIPGNNKYDSSIEGGDSYGEESKALDILRDVQKNIYAYASVSMKDVSQDTSRISFGFENTEQLGKVVVYKTGTTYTKSEKNVSTKETKYGKQYVLKHTLTDLSDVEYTIYADGEIQSGTGETLFKDGEVVGIMKTKNGKASFDGLHVGSYILAETSTLKGYILPKNSTRFTIEHEGQNVVREFSFNNDSQTMNVEIWKKMEDYSSYSDAYKGVLFGLYTKKEITDEKDNVLIPANALVGITTVFPKDDYFVGNFEEKLPYGSYYVKEIKTDSRYILDPTEYPVEFQFVDYITKVVNIHVNMDNGGYIFNYLKPIGKITPTYKKDTPKEITKTKAKRNTKVTTSKTSVPKTGDDSPLGLYWFLLIASSIPMVWMLFGKFRKKTRTRTKKMKGSRMLLFLLLLSCFLLCREESFAAKKAEDTITKEKIYKTKEADYVRGMPQNTFQKEIKENGKTFALDRSDIKYTIKSVTPKYEQVSTSYKVSKSGLSKRNYRPDPSVMTTDKFGNDVEVKLQSVSYKENRSTVTQNVSTKTNFGYLIEEPDVPQKKTTSVKNKITGKKQSVTCSLKDVTKSAAKWKKDKASTITVEGYGSSHYRLGGVTLDADSVEDLTSNGDVILNYLGLDTATHKIVGVTWNGEAFDVNANGNTIRCRKATATISRKVQHYVANYTGTLEIPVTTYTGTAYYSSNNRVQVGQEYEVKATAHYVQTEVPVASPEPTKKPQTKPVKKQSTSNVPLIAAVSIGIVLLCVCIVLILYYSSKKKRKGEW